MFGAEKLTWRSYTIAEALPTTSRVELIDKREFVKAALDKNSETFVVHVSALEATENSIYPSQAAQMGCSAVRQGLFQNSGQIFWQYWCFFIGFSDRATWEYRCKQAYPQVDRGETTTLRTDLCPKSSGVRDTEDL